MEKAGKSKSKNDTWSERELSRHIAKGTKLNKTSPEVLGSPKSQTKATKASTNFIRREPLKHEKPRSSTVAISPSPTRKGLGYSRKDSVSRTKDAAMRPKDTGVRPKDTAMRPSGRVKPESQKKEEKPSLRGSRSSDDRQKKDAKQKGGGQGQSPVHKTSSKALSSQSPVHKVPSYSASPIDPTASRKDKAHRSDKRSEHSVKGGKAGQSSGAEKASDKQKGSEKKITVHETPPHSPPEIEEDLPEDTHPQPMMEVEDGYSYDEDFESYEEDFDTDEDSDSNSGKAVIAKNLGPGKSKTGGIGEVQGATKEELLELMEAMEMENTLVKEASESPLVLRRMEQPSGSVGLTSSNSDRVAGSNTRSRVDFSTAQKRNEESVVAKRARKRGQEILSLIEMDIVAYDMLDISPLSEYEVYVKKFGWDDTRQVAVQSGEDNMEAETQTDVVDTANVWVQWPPEDLRGFGREGERGEGIVEGVADGLSGRSAMGLVSFLKRAGQVCSVLLEENLEAVGKSHSHSMESPFPFCSTHLSIHNIPSRLHGWHVNHAHFSPNQDQLILASYSRPMSGVKVHNAEGMICIWNSRDLAQPNMVLTCQPVATCCCFSPHKASLAFAGGDDGSIVLWDLREPSSMHRPLTGGEGAHGRVPTFSTAGIPDLYSHHAPVVSICSISLTPDSTSSDVPHSSSSSSSSSSIRSAQEDLTGLSFQLASLDKSGIFKLWVIVELATPDFSGSDSDLGLAPGGRVKLVKSASVNLVSDPNSRGQRSLNSAATSIQVHCLQFRPCDANHIYVGMDTGCVLHHTRYGHRAIPRYHLPPGGSRDHPTDGEGACNVSSISFSPWQPDHFLAGCSDGSIRMYHTKRAQPIHCWTNTTAGAGITTLHWARHCPGLFIVMDSASNLHVWDIIENDARPVFSQKLKSNVTYCTQTLSGHHSPALLLAYEEGPLELHYLKRLPRDSKLQTQREQKLVAYFNSLL